MGVRAAGYKFVIFEVSSKIGRHFWRRPAVPLEGDVRRTT
jgi:hypothetical protein